jgi:hypothetical protein
MDHASRLALAASQISPGEVSPIFFLHPAHRMISAAIIDAGDASLLLLLLLLGSSSSSLPPDPLARLLWMHDAILMQTCLSGDWLVRENGLFRSPRSSRSFLPDSRQIHHLFCSLPNTALPIIRAITNYACL